MKVKVALTGASGNMGSEALRQLLELEDVEFVRILVLGTSAKDRAFGAAAKKNYGDRVQVVEGDLAVKADCRALVEGMDYVFHIGAIIPPLSDHKPKATDLANRVGTMNMVDSCMEQEKRPKFVYTSTVAVYGHRNYLHPWGRVGDPLLPSVYDVYAATKVKAERYVMESGLEWAVIRQTAMLHYNMMKANMSDGLMFHTCVNVPLEWVSSRDSGLLVKRIVERDLEGKADAFWRRCFNIGGGAENRVTGYDTYEILLNTFGIEMEKVMKPGWNSIRNFHGLWFADGPALNDLFDYQHDSFKGFCNEILKRFPIYKAAGIVPSGLISKFAFERLLGTDNSPLEWVKTGDEGRVRAFFGSRDNLECLPDSWEGFPVLAKGEIADGNVDYDAMRDIKNVKKMGYLLSHGYDESKPDSELDLADMRDAAAFRGGECLSESMTKGDLYTPLTWRCHDGHEFVARPYTVLKAGHWCPDCCQPEPWDFDRLSKFMPFFAQVWYDSHAREENTEYFTNGRKALYRRFK